MPLSFQVSDLIPAEKTCSLAVGNKRARHDQLEPRSVDLRLSCDSLADLQQLHQSLGGDHTLWLNVMVHPTQSFALTVNDEIAAGRFRRMSVVGQQNGVLFEVSLEQHHAYFRRFDDRLCYENIGDESLVLRIKCQMDVGDRDRKVSVYNAVMHRFYLLFEEACGELRTYPTPKFGTPPVTHSNSQLMSTTQSRLTRISPMFFGFQCAEQRIDSLSLRVEREQMALLSELWKNCINELTRANEAHLCTQGTLEQLTQIVHKVDIHHENRRSSQNGYGLLAVNLDAGSAWQAAEETLGVNTVSLRDWDVRWQSVLTLDLPNNDSIEVKIRDIQLSNRGGSNRMHFIEIPCESFSTPTFRICQDRLSHIYGPPILKRAYWQYQGPPAESLLGRHYGRLRHDLESAVASRKLVLESNSPKTLRAPSLVTYMRSRFTKKSAVNNFAEHLEPILVKQLPGFRYDVNAHPSDQNFIEFYREHPFGVELIQMQRLHNPEGLTVSLGVSKTRVYLDELVVAKNRVAPGIALDFNTLLPEHYMEFYPTYTKYTRHRTFEALVEHLKYFAEPFFETTRTILRSHENLDLKEN